MDGDPLLAWTSSRCHSLHMHSDNDVAQLKTWPNLKQDGRALNRGDCGASSRGLCNHVQFRQAAVLPEVTSLHQVRKIKIKGQEKEQEPEPAPALLLNMKAIKLLRTLKTSTGAGLTYRKRSLLTSY